MAVKMVLLCMLVAFVAGEADASLGVQTGGTNVMPHAQGNRLPDGKLAARDSGLNIVLDEGATAFAEHKTNKTSGRSRLSAQQRNGQAMQQSGAAPATRSWPVDVQRRRLHVARRATSDEDGTSGQTAEEEEEETRLEQLGLGKAGEAEMDRSIMNDVEAKIADDVSTSMTALGGDSNLSEVLLLLNTQHSATKRSTR
jgi:hypothetical protein